MSTAFYIPMFGKTLKLNAEYYYTDFKNQAVVDYDATKESYWIFHKDGDDFDLKVSDPKNPRSLYVDGLKDAVVAASPDGIFVCSKKYSEDIKKAVEHLTPRPMYEERRWGTYRVIDDSKYADGNHSLTKSITLKPGKNISYQLHHHRSEVWTFVEGEGIFVLDGEEKHVKAGDTVVIPLEHYHAIKAITQLTFIEVQNGNPLVEEDIERFDYQWKMK